MEEQITYANRTVYFSVTNVLVINEQNQLLILRRAEWKRIPGEDYRPDLSHQTDLPGGMVGDEVIAEDLTISALRELAEETGIQANSDQLRLAYVETVYDESNQRSQARLIYLMKLDYTPTIDLSWEHESFEWRDIKDIVGSNYLHSSVHRHAVDYIMSHPNIFKI